MAIITTTSVAVLKDEELCVALISLSFLLSRTLFPSSCRSSHCTATLIVVLNCICKIYFSSRLSGLLPCFQAGRGQVRCLCH